MEGNVTTWREAVGCHALADRWGQEEVAERGGNGKVFFINLFLRREMNLFPRLFALWFLWGSGVASTLEQTVAGRIA